MSLRTAPCTHCRARIVFGQRRCPSCGTAFDYGASPPPEPTPHEVQDALMAADIQAQIEAQSGPQRAAPGPAAAAVRPSMGGVRPSLRSGEGAPVAGGRPVLRSGEGAPVATRPAAQSPSSSVPGIPRVPGVPSVPGIPSAPAAPRPAAAAPAVPSGPSGAAAQPAAQPYAPVSVPSGAPVVDDDLIDRGRYDDVASAPVQTEDIPGFVDSTLFRAFTPDVVETEHVEGLEQTSYDDVGAASIATEYVPVEHTGQDSVGAVQTEDIPGFVDSTLFRAFTPDVVQTEDVEGLEVSSSAMAARRKPVTKRPAAGDEAAPCSDCGTRHEKAVCPSCGARRKGAG